MEGTSYWLALLCVAFIYLLSLSRRINRRRLTLKWDSSVNTTPQSVKSTTLSLPSPFRMPIIGHLYLLQGNPIIEMTKLSKTYGEIYSLQLGSVETVVVTSLKLIRQILIEKGSDFGDRPNFLRYNVLFGNDKENSLAFCNWTTTQKTRRALARRFCHTGLFADRVDKALERSGELLIENIQRDLESHQEPFSRLKLSLQKACANVFFDFFCSEVYYDWDNDTEFETVVQLFDSIFWEINQSHPTDVLPSLAPFFNKHLKSLANMGIDIRKFVVKRIIETHQARLDKDNPEDFVDILLTHLEDAEPNNRLTVDQVLYELEDFLGGHAAVSNLLCRALVEIGSCPGMSKKIYQKHFEEQNKDYIQAVIYETLRRTSSPIVPHVASVDSIISGYMIKKGTMMLINNYDLNMSEEYWTEPQHFIPERFLRESGQFRKPAHFFPFSYGKRACMGYQLVEKVTEGLILSIIQNYDIEAMDNPTQLPIASVALHPNEHLRLRMISRS